MNTRSIQTIVLAAALAILANFFQPAGALAMRTPCCCSGDACKCCCASQQAPQPADMLFVPLAPAAGDCSCSSPIPYGRDTTTATHINQFCKKKPLKTGALSSLNRRRVFANITPTYGDRPPPRFNQCRFLLKCSLLI